MNAPLKKLNELARVAFDGRRRGYLPPSRHHAYGRRDAIELVCIEIGVHVRDYLTGLVPRRDDRHRGNRSI
jgi:hypothetical protein